MLTRIRRISQDESGVTLVEYGIALLLAITVGAFALSQLAGAVDTRITSACTKISSATDC